MTASPRRWPGVVVSFALTVLACVSFHSCACADDHGSTSPVQTWTHETGATVYLVEKHDFPYVTFGVTLRSGALWDPLDRTGLATVTAHLLVRGAGTRDRAAVAEDLERLGTQIEIDVGQVAMSFDGDALKRRIDDVFAILSDVILRPRLAKDELERTRRERISEILRTRDRDRALNLRFFRRYLFGAHPYGMPASGTIAGIKKVTAEDVRRFHKDHFVADNVIFGFSGDITREEVDALLSRHFAELPKGKAPNVELPRLTPPKGRQVLLVDKPERTQNQIQLGHLAPTADVDDHYALAVVNSLFGGTFTARLNQEVRDKRGLSYGAYSYVEADKVGGVFRMWTFPATDDGMKTVNLLIELLERLKRDKVTQEELEFAKKYLANSYAFEIDTPDDLLAEAVIAEIEGRPAGYVQNYVERIKAVTLADVNRVIDQYLDPDNFLLVMLCTAAGFEEPLRGLPHVTTVKVVPYDVAF